MDAIERDDHAALWLWARGLKNEGPLFDLQFEWLAKPGMPAHGNLIELLGLFYARTSLIIFVREAFRQRHSFAGQWTDRWLAKIDDPKTPSPDEIMYLLLEVLRPESEEHARTLIALAQPGNWGPRASAVLLEAGTVYLAKHEAQELDAVMNKAQPVAKVGGSQRL